MKRFLVHLRNITACLLVITFSYIQRSQGADFSAALSLTLAKEGGYVNNKKVRGGETYCGINRKSHRRWEGWKIIDKNHLKWGDKLPELDEMVASFYREHYWNKIRGDEIHSQKTANRFFNTAVRKGIDRAIMSKQRSFKMKPTGKMNDALVKAINKKH